ncbi:MAG: hypothetical protein FH758_15600 [Firmicutes bacterium]|nr:hypothetical protein [Bacillota bacterium]
MRRMHWYIKGSVQKYFVFALLFCTALFLVINFIFSSGIPDLVMAQGSAMPASFYFAAEVNANDYPGTLMVFRYNDEPITEQEIMMLTDKLKMGEYIIHNISDKEWVVHAKEKTILVEKDSGMWTYQDVSARHRNAMGGNNLPSDDSVVQLAKKQLNEIGIDPDTFSTVGVGNTTVGTEIVRKSAYFYRQIDGYDIVGTSKLVVEIGRQGKVEAISKHYCDYQPYKAFQLKSIDQAMDELQQGKAQYQCSQLLTGEATVYEIDIAYYSSPVNVPESFLQPVYVFNGEVISPDGPLSFRAVLPAVHGVNIKWQQ